MIRPGTPPVPTRLWPWLTAGLVAALVGCSNRPVTAPTVTAARQVDPADELVNSVRDDLRKGTDLATCKRVVDQLNNYLPRARADRRPAALSPGERSALEKDFAFRPEEVAEVARAEYTTPDAYYLEQSFFFRDVARSLDVDRLPPVARSEAAVAWVDRNLRAIPPAGPALPPNYEALRGAGTPVERTYAVHALLRQLGIDPVLVGDGGPDTVWAVGVPADGQIHLFDARLGLPLPGPDGTGILTLAQARSAADPFKPLAVDPKQPYDVTADRAKKAEVLVTAPLSALSPRMRFVQEILGADVVRLAADPAAARDRVKAAAGGATVRLWCPPVIDALPRVLFTFLPPSEGGSDPTPPGSIHRKDRYYAEQVPVRLLPPFLQQLQGEPVQRVMSEFIARTTFLSQPGQAHDLILRGRFREATDQLVGIQSQAKRKPANPAELVKATQEWAEAAREYAADVARRERGRAEPGTFERMELNRAKAEMLWQNPRGPRGLLDYIVSDSLAAEATYLLALCKHEEAERLMHRPETAGTAGPAWKAARQWWSSYVSGYPNSPVVPAAKRNLARALEAEGQKDQARARYAEAAESAQMPLERLACRYLAEKVK